MASRLNPYLNVLDGKAREALEFYQSVLGGELTVMTFGDMGTEGPMATQVMHGQLEGEHGVRLMGSDTPSRMEYRPGSNVSLSLSGDDEALLRGWFEELSAGGEVLQPLEKAPWGDSFGMCADRFGVTWLVNINGQPG